MRSRLSIVLALVLLAVAAPLALAQTAPAPAAVVTSPLAIVLNALVGAIAAAGVALIKNGIFGGLDSAIGSVLKKFQPFVALILSALLPALWHLLPANGVPVPDVSALINAPLATVIGIVLAELVALVRGKFPVPDPAALKR